MYEGDSSNLPRLKIYLLNSKAVFLDWGKYHTLFEKVLFTHLYKNDMAAFLISTVTAHFLMCTFEILF